MRFVLDHNVERRMAPALQALGHDVWVAVRDYHPSLPDRDLLALAQREDRILITNDSDFGELVVRARLLHAGVLFVRMPTATTSEKIARLTAVLAGYGEALEAHAFLTVTPTSVRIRPADPSSRPA